MNAFSKAGVIDDLLRFTDSLCRGLEERPEASHHAARELFSKHLEVLKAAKLLCGRDPYLAPAVILKEEELIWAIRHLEDVISANQ